MTDDVFPIETVARIYDDSDKLAKIVKKPKSQALGLMNGFSEAFYSFRDSMVTGKYAPYLHERFEISGIYGYNCTTVIPDMFLHCERLKLNPEIVQLVGMQRIGKDNSEETGENSVHFALTIDIGKKRRYLFDPFWSTFGPILEQDDHQMKIGSSDKYTKTLLKFDRMAVIPAQAFAELMNRMHDPAGSLEMLVAGQKIYSNRSIAKTNCALMVYYDPEANVISTRLSVPQVAISEKAVYCTMDLTSGGNVSKTYLDLFLAKSCRWIGLSEGEHVAKTDFWEISQLRRELSAASGFSYSKRIGSILKEKMSPLLEKLTDSLLERLGTGVVDINRKIIARALYELEKPDLDYIFSVEEREKKLFELIKKNNELNEKIKAYADPLWLMGWNLVPTDISEKGKLKRAKDKLDRENAKIIKELNCFNQLRKDNKPVFHRTMDKVLFSKQIEDASDSDFKAMVEQKGIDVRVGYLAMVADFIPFIVEGKKDLTLKESLGQLREKVAAKYRSLPSKIHNN